jgi:hypothetical protein
MSTPQYPLEVLPPKTIDIGWDGMSIEGGRSLSGISSAIEFTGGGILTVKYGDVLYNSIQQHKAITRLAAHLAGSVRSIIVPILSDWTGPFALDSSGYPVIQVLSTHDDGSTFDDGAYYSQSAVVAVTEAASDPDVPGTLEIRVTSGGVALEGGEWFALQHPTKSWRAYCIREIDSSTEDGDETVYTVALDRPLRETATAGMTVEFSRPRCLMRLRAGQKLNWKASGKWLGSAEFDLVESF